jgi:DNA-binding beta-propeller fold protein YncE
MKRDSVLIQVIVTASMGLACSTVALGQDAPPEPNTTYEAYLVETIPLPVGFDMEPERKGRFSDMAISADGTTAWLCEDQHSKAVYGFDIASGKPLKGFGEFSNPQRIQYHPASNRLYVVETNKSDDQRGAIVHVFDPANGKREHSLPVHDWRLYRVADAALSPDGDQMWLASSPTESSFYGDVSAALFRVNLKNGDWKQLYGPRLAGADTPMGRATLAYPDENPLRMLRVAVDSSGRVFAINLKHSFLSVFPPGSDTPDHEHKLDFAPSLLCRAGQDNLLIAGKGRIILIDTKTMKEQAAAYISGTPTAICTDTAGTRAFIAMENSAEVLVMNTASSSIDRNLGTPNTGPTFAQPVQLPNGNIDRLFFLGRPERLIGIGNHGYEPFVLNLENGAVLARYAGLPPRANRLRINPRTHTAVVTLDRGRIVIVNLKPGGLARTIHTSGDYLMDAVFTGDDTVLVSDSRNMRLLHIDLLRGRTLGSTLLENYPYGLALHGDGRSVGIVFGYRNAPNTAVLDLVTSKTGYYANPKELPDEWKDLHERASGRISHGENTGVGIQISSWADVATVTLRLSSGKKAVFRLPGKYEPKDLSVAIGPDETFAYVLSDANGLRFPHPDAKPALLKFRLTPTE